MFANDFNSQTCRRKFLFQIERERKNRRKNLRREREKKSERNKREKIWEIKREEEKVSSQLLYVWSVLDRCSNCSSLSIRVQKVCDTLKNLCPDFSSLSLSWSRGWRRKFERERERGRERGGRVSDRRRMMTGQEEERERQITYCYTFIFFDALQISLSHFPSV